MKTLISSGDYSDTAQCHMEGSSPLIGLQMLSTSRVWRRAGGGPMDGGGERGGGRGRGWGVGGGTVEIN